MRINFASAEEFQCLLMGNYILGSSVETIDPDDVAAANSGNPLKRDNHVLRNDQDFRRPGDLRL